MSQNVPTVSVCVPAYNAAPYLGDTIDSVLCQGLEDFELVISDDASDDATPAVCDRYDDERLRVERSPRRLGQAGNWNRCIHLARGKYVLLLHADDQLVAGYLEKAVEVLDANEDVGLVHCAAQHIDEAGHPLTLQRLFDRDIVDRADTILHHLLLDGCVINPAGVTVRRTVYEVVGGFTDKTVWGVDWHMWIRIALRFRLAYLAQPLALYRQHSESGTSAVMLSGRNAHDERWAAEDLFSLIRRIRPDLYGLRKATLKGVAHRTWCFAEAACERGDMPAARAGLRNAVRISPSMAADPKVWALWAATYLGYDWFVRAVTEKRRVADKLRHPAPNRR